jgi:hypothetical protein
MVAAVAPSCSLHGCINASDYPSSLEPSPCLRLVARSSNFFRSPIRSTTMAVEQKLRMSGEIPKTESPACQWWRSLSNLHRDLHSIQQYISRELNSTFFTLPLSHAWHRDTDRCPNNCSFWITLSSSVILFNKWIIDKRKFGCHPCHSS